MKILIIGAGVLGSNLAHSIKKDNNITILARNKTYEKLKNKGLIIKHKLKGKTIDHFNIINKLEKNDIYDVIFIVTRCSALDDIVPIVENNDSKNIVFVGNNLNVEKYMNIKNKNILFAFFMAAGKKNDDYIESICLNKIVIGRADGKNDNDELIKSIFQKSKIKLIIENKMSDYLKTHGCAILPLVFASYKANGNLKLLKKDKEYSLLILPKGEYENCVNKKERCAFIYRFLFSNFLGKMCISNHAMSAKEEFILMENEFEKLKKKAGIKTKVYDNLKLALLNYNK